MENDEARELRIFDERAQALATAPAALAKRRAEFTVTVIEAGGERFGIPCVHLREIVHCPRLARFPGVPSWCRGLVQIRGELMTVVDLPDLIGLGRSKDAGFIAVVFMDHRSIAVLVNSIIGLRDVYADDIAEGLEQTYGIDENVFHATTRDLVAILDLARLLDKVGLHSENGNT
jgi:chemotaxis signal transduction protein